MDPWIEVSGAGNSEADGIYVPRSATLYEKTGTEWKIMFHLTAKCWFIGFRPSLAHCAYFSKEVGETGDFTARKKWWSSASDPPAPVVTKHSKRKRDAHDISTVQQKLWKDKKFTDAEVVCAGERISIHRAQVCAASPVLDAAFTSMMKEGQTCVYTIKDSCPEAVKHMLEYMYTGSCEAASAELLDLAIQYQVEGLAASTADTLAQHICVQNVRKVVLVLKRHQDHEYVKRALDKLVSSVLADESGKLYLASV